MAAYAVCALKSRLYTNPTFVFLAEETMSRGFFFRMRKVAVAGAEHFGRQSARGPPVHCPDQLRPSK